MRKISMLLPLLSLVFTVFVFANTFEVVMNRDIAFAQSVRKVAAQSVINSIVSEFQAKPNVSSTSGISELAGLDSLEIPALKIQVELEESRTIDGMWYQRPSVGHYVGLNKDTNNVTVDYLIYTSKSWQAVPEPGQIDVGMEVQVHYGKGASSSFVVAEKKALPLNRSFIVDKAEDRQILLIVEDANNNLYYGYSLVLRKQSV